MVNKVFRYILASQLCLFAALTACYLVLPEMLYQGRGVSNYGVHHQTIVLYSLGFGLCAVFLAIAARYSAAVKSRIGITNALYVLAVLYGLVLLSTYPYKLNDFLGNLHTIVGTVLFAFQLFLAGYLAAKTRNWLVILLLVIQVGASLVLLVALVRITSLLFTGQLFAGLAFGALVVLGVPALLRAAPSGLEPELVVREQGDVENP